MRNGGITRMKKWLYFIVEHYSIVMRIYLCVFNKFDVKNKDNIRIEGRNIRKNHVVVRGNSVINIGKACSIQNNTIHIEGHNNRVILGESVELYGQGKRSIFVKGDNNKIVIGNYSKIEDGNIFILGNNNQVHIESKFSGIAVEFHIEEDNNKLLINKGTSMHGRDNRNIHIALDEGTTVHIGEDCMFSNNIQIRTSDSHSIISTGKERINPAKDIKVGNHCWLGLGCMLMKGTELADSTVVAAGAICTKKYEHGNVVLAGNPAKVIKEKIDWDRKLL